MEHKDYVDIPLPLPIVNKIREKIKDTEFGSVAEYIVFIVKEVLGDEDQKSGLTKEEEDQVKATLKKLGYLKDE